MSTTVMPRQYRGKEGFVLCCETECQGLVILSFESYKEGDTEIRHPTLFPRERDAFLDQVEAFEMAIDAFKMDPEFDFEHLQFPPHDQHVLKCRVDDQGWIHIQPDEHVGGNLVWTGDENGTMEWPPA